MTMWDPDKLTRFGDSEEVELASRRPDGSLRPYVTIWIVSAEDTLFVRSAHGPENGWYRRALRSALGSLRIPGLECDVQFLKHESRHQREIDEAYLAKYGAQYPDLVEHVVGPDVYDVTLRLDQTPL